MSFGAHFAQSYRKVVITIRVFSVCSTCATVSPNPYQTCRWWRPLDVPKSHWVQMGSRTGRRLLSWRNWAFVLECSRYVLHLFFIFSSFVLHVFFIFSSFILHFFFIFSSFFLHLFFMFSSFFLHVFAWQPRLKQGGGRDTTITITIIINRVCMHKTGWYGG